MGSPGFKQKIHFQTISGLTFVCLVIIHIYHLKIKETLQLFLKICFSEGGGGGEEVCHKTP